MIQAEIVTKSTLDLLQKQGEAIEKLAKEIRYLREMNQRPLNTKEAAEYIGLSYSRFMAIYKKEGIPFIQRNRKVLFHIQDLEEWISKNKVE